METLLKSKRRVQIDIDSDEEIEEVVGFLQKTFLIKNGSVVWEKVGAGVNLVTKVHDINGDGKPEILVGGSERKIAIYDPNGEKLKEIRYWSAGDKRAGWVWDIAIDDINGDGKPEILVGGMAAWGSEGIDVKLYDPEFNEIWSYRVPRSAIRVIIDDLKASGEKQAIIVTYNGQIILLNKDGKEIKKTSLGSNLVAIDIADLDGDGKKELIIGSADGEIFVLNHDLKRIWMTKISEHGIVPVYTLKVHDFNNDGKAEVLVTGRRLVGLYDSEGKLIKIKDNNVLEINGIKVDIKIDTIEIEEDGDIKRVKLEDWIEAGAIAESSGDKLIALVLVGNKLLLLNSKGEILKEFENDDGFTAIDLSDVDNDGELEILTGTAAGDILVYKMSGEVIYRSKLYGDIGVISALDIDNDGKNEIIASTKNQADELVIIKL